MFRDLWRDCSSLWNRTILSRTTWVWIQVKRPDAKLRIAVDAEKVLREMCQQRLIAAHCFHPRKCFGSHLHPTQQPFCYQAVNFSSTTFLFFPPAFLLFGLMTCHWLVYWIAEKKRFRCRGKKKDFLSRGLSCLAGVWSVELLEGGRIFFHRDR